MPNEWMNEISMRKKRKVAEKTKTNRPSEASGAYKRKEKKNNAGSIYKWHVSREIKNIDSNAERLLERKHRWHLLSPNRSRWESECLVASISRF
jgi:hypothetical protein